MSCQLVEAKLDLYVEGELAPTEVLEIEGHLRTCPACGNRAASLQQMTTLLRQLTPAEPAPSLLPRLVAVVEARSAQVTARLATGSMRTGPAHRRWPQAAVTGLGMVFSAFLLLWLAVETLLALEENGAAEFLSLFASRPEILSSYPSEAIYAFLESLPVANIVLTLGLSLVVLLLMQQLLSALAYGRSVGLNGSY
jgi:anti-sigma factor RsiW